MRPVTRKPARKINRMIKKKICIDFDGTIYPNKYRDNRIDNDTPPINGFVEFYQSMSNTHILVVNSARCEDEHQIALIEAYLKHNGTPMKVCRFKPMAHYYVDDKGISFTGDWIDIKRQIQ